MAVTASLGYSILILEWAGKSLDILSSQELAALNPVSAWMKSLRQVHVAGVVHGDLALRNIAYDNSVFTFLDWETSDQYDEDGGRRDKAALQASFSSRAAHT